MHLDNKTKMKRKELTLEEIIEKSSLRKAINNIGVENDCASGIYHDNNPESQIKSKFQLQELSKFPNQHRQKQRLEYKNYNSTQLNQSKKSKKSNEEKESKKLNELKSRGGSQSLSKIPEVKGAENQQFQKSNNNNLIPEYTISHEFKRKTIEFEIGTGLGDKFGMGNHIDKEGSSNKNPNKPPKNPFRSIQTGERKKHSIPDSNLLNPLKYRHQSFLIPTNLKIDKADRNSGTSRTSRSIQGKVNPISGRGKNKGNNRHEHESENQLLFEPESQLGEKEKMLIEMKLKQRLNTENVEGKRNSISSRSVKENTNGKRNLQEKINTKVKENANTNDNIHKNDTPKIPKAPRFSQASRAIHTEESTAHLTIESENDEENGNKSEDETNLDDYLPEVSKKTRTTKTKFFVPDFIKPSLGIDVMLEKSKTGSGLKAGEADEGMNDGVSTNNGTDNAILKNNNNEHNRNNNYSENHTKNYNKHEQPSELLIKKHEFVSTVPSSCNNNQKKFSITISSKEKLIKERAGLGSGLGLGSGFESGSKLESKSESEMKTTNSKRKQLICSFTSKKRKLKEKTEENIELCGWNEEY